MSDERLLFLDVDGVLLDYEGQWVPWLIDRGHSVPADFRTRTSFYFNEAYPEYWNQEAEQELVEAFGLQGGLATLQPIISLDLGSLTDVLLDPRTYLLSTFKESFRTDRIKGLQNAFGTKAFADKVLSSFSIKKGKIMKDVCERHGTTMANAMLVDDVRSNLDSAQSMGAQTLLAEHVYNLKDRVAHASAPHPKLVERFKSFLGAP